YPDFKPVSYQYRKLRRYPFVLTQYQCRDGRVGWYGTLTIDGWDEHGLIFKGTSTLEVMVFCATGIPLFYAWIADSSAGGHIVDLCDFTPGAGSANNIPGNKLTWVTQPYSGSTPFDGTSFFCNGCCYIAADRGNPGTGYPTPGPPMTENSALGYEIICGPNCVDAQWPCPPLEVPTSLHVALASSGAPCFNGFQFDMRMVYDFGVTDSSGNVLMRRKFIHHGPWPCFSLASGSGSGPTKIGYSELG